MLLRDRDACDATPLCPPTRPPAIRAAFWLLLALLLVALVASIVAAVAVGAVQPLLGELAFTRDNRNWGYQLRFGLFEIADADMDVIAAAMQRKCQAGAISGPECASRHAHAR